MKIDKIMISETSFQSEDLYDVIHSNITVVNWNNAVNKTILDGFQQMNAIKMMNN